MAETTIDHDEIRQWAESKGGVPAAVDRTHKDGDVGIIRIMFPDAPNSHHEALVEISWDEFFEEFEDRGLALLYDEKSLFSKIVGRDTAEKRAEGDNSASRHRDRDAGGAGERGSGKDDGKSAGSTKGGGAGADEGGGEGRGSEAAGERNGRGEGGTGRSGGDDEEASLKRREYRDEKGEIHHHTNTYMAEHGGRGGKGG